jgi:hypothetical protein
VAVVHTEEWSRQWNGDPTIALDALDACNSFLASQGLESRPTVTITWHDGRAAGEDSVEAARRTLRPQPPPTVVAGFAGTFETNASISVGEGRFNVISRSQDKDLAERLVEAARSVIAPPAGTPAHPNHIEGQGQESPAPTRAQRQSQPRRATPRPRARDRRRPVEPSDRWPWWPYVALLAAIATILGTAYALIDGDDDSPETKPAPETASRPQPPFADRLDRVCLSHYDRMRAADRPGDTYPVRLAKEARVAHVTDERLRALEPPVRRVLDFRNYLRAKRRAARARTRLAEAVEMDPTIEVLGDEIGQAGIALDEAQREAVAAALALDASVCGKHPELE